MTIRIKEINIPFNYCNHTGLGSFKTCTTRTRAYGKPGDTFRVDDRLFRLTFVEKAPLWKVAAFYFTQEGFKSALEFKKVWSNIHYRTGYNPAQPVVVHFFKEVDKNELLF